MSEENNFKKKLDELIQVFKKLKEKDEFKKIINDDMQIKNIEMIINNYDFIKNNIPDNILEDLGENIESIIIDLTNQLKEELEDEEDTSNNEIINDIDMIDNILSSKQLSEDKINELLDQRNSLKLD